MNTTTKVSQLRSMKREGTELLKKMDAQAKSLRYEDLKKTLANSKEIRKRMAAALKGH